MGRMRRITELIREFGAPLGHSDNFVHFPSPIAGEVVDIPKSKIAGGYGNVRRMLDNEPSLGEVYHDPSGRKTLDELKQHKVQKEVIEKESDEAKKAIEKEVDPLAEKTQEHGVHLEDDADPIERIRREKEAAALAHRNKKVGGFAGLMGASQAAHDEMNPMNPLKEIGYAVKPAYDAYNKIKDKFFTSGAKQLDFTGQTPEIVKPAAAAMNMVGDPLNYVPGGVGMAAGAAQMGLDILPEKESNEIQETPEEKQKRFSKLRELMGKP